LAGKVVLYLEKDFNSKYKLTERDNSAFLINRILIKTKLDVNY